MSTQVRNIAFIMLLLPGTVTAQEERRTGPLTVVTSRYKDTYLKITYSQPQRKGRTIFGSLVPYGKVWRTGANEATEMTVTQDIQINGQVLDAGTYSLFTIPEKDHWTVIINSDLGLWGSYNYNEKKDIMRFDVATQVLEQPEDVFMIQIDPVNDKAKLYLMWEKVKVSLDIQYSEPEPEPEP